jgi:hypothetical protein
VLQETEGTTGAVRPLKEGALTAPFWPFVTSAEPLPPWLVSPSLAPVCGAGCPSPLPPACGGFGGFGAVVVVVVGATVTPVVGAVVVVDGTVVEVVVDVVVVELVVVVAAGAVAEVVAPGPAAVAICAIVTVIAIVARAIRSRLIRAPR